MAKSKEQKVREAILRAQKHYLEYDLPYWFNLSPAGKWWEDNVTWAVQWNSLTQSLLKKAKSANVSLLGKADVYDVLTTWSALELMNWLLASGNILEMATVYIKYLTENEIYGPQTRLHLDVPMYPINAVAAAKYYKVVK